MDKSNKTCASHKDKIVTCYQMSKVNKLCHGFIQEAKILKMAPQMGV